MLLEAGCCFRAAKLWLQTSDYPTAAAEVRQQYIAEGHSDVIDFVLNTSTAPHRLSCLCRRALRAQLSKRALTMLPLPNVLKKYVAM